MFTVINVDLGNSTAINVVFELAPNRTHTLVNSQAMKKS